MVYMWALFRHQKPLLGAFFEVIVVVLAVVSIAIPLIWEEEMLAILIASCLALLCFILFIFFAKSDKVRRRISNN